jgi:glutamate-1-semialdehyde 2,1-aminomutase
MDNTNSLDFYERALQVIPGGVSSPVRAFRHVGGSPVFMESANGAYLHDVDGNRYIDYVQSFGASILGHADKRVINAIAEAAAKGTSFAAPTLAEVELSEKIIERVPGCEKIRFTSSGTEAVMTAVRLARACTKRSKIIKFDGCYHGHSDALLAGAGSGAATLPDSAGVTKGAVSDTVVLPYNKIPDIDDTVACVIVEPAAANMGLVPPCPGFLAGLRAACDAAGAILIFDEVITGFRVSYGGASSLTSIQPDLWCFGKVVGGGLPLAAVGGKKEIMDRLAPLGDVYQAGTLSGNPLATAAGKAVLDALTPESYIELEQKTEYLALNLKEVFVGSGITVTVSSYKTLMSLFFGVEFVNDYEDTRLSAESKMYPKFFHAMLSRGVYLAPSPYETWFVSLAHGSNELEATIKASALFLEDLLLS